MVLAKWYCNESCLALTLPNPITSYDQVMQLDYTANETNSYIVNSILDSMKTDIQYGLNST
jgi:hypothetical protein